MVVAVAVAVVAAIVVVVIALVFVAVVVVVVVVVVEFAQVVEVVLVVITVCAVLFLSASLLLSLWSLLLLSLLCCVAVVACSHLRVYVCFLCFLFPLFLVVLIVFAVVACVPAQISLRVGAMVFIVESGLGLSHLSDICAFCPPCMPHGFRAGGPELVGVQDLADLDQEHLARARRRGVVEVAPDEAPQGGHPPRPRRHAHGLDGLDGQGREVRGEGRHQPSGDGEEDGRRVPRGLQGSPPGDR